MTQLSDEQAWLSTGALVILVTFAVAVALSFAQAVMVPFVLAIFIYTMVAPLMDALVRRFRAPHLVGVAVAMLAVLGPILLIGLLMITATQALVATANEYRDDLAAWAEDGFVAIEKLNVNLGQETVLQTIRDFPLLSVVGGAVGSVLDVTTTGVLLLFFLVFLLAGRNPNKSLPAIYTEIDVKVRRYVVTKFTISAVTGLLVWLVLLLFGLKLAWLFGVLAFSFNFIPSVGSVIATLLPLPIAVAQFQDPWLPWHVAGVVLIPGALQLIVGNVIEPKLMGRGLELHPVTILLSLAFWGLIWGIMGMVLAVPMTAAIRIVFMQFETTRAAAELLAGRLPEMRQAAEKPAT